MQRCMLGLAALVACESSPTPVNTSGVDPSVGAATESTSDPSTTSLGSSSTSTSSESSSSTSSPPTADSSSGPQPEPPITWDLGGIPDSPGEQVGCRAVDFLFVIDNSGSMATFQTNLVSNFGAFISGIQDTLVEVDSYHIGVITSDAYSYNVEG